MCLLAMLACCWMQILQKKAYSTVTVCAHELKNWDLLKTRHHVGGSFLDGTTFIPTYKSVPSMLLQCLPVV